MKQSNITPGGVYESRDGMVRTVSVVTDDGQVIYRPNAGDTGPPRKSSIKNFAAWAVRRRADVQLVQTPVMREAAASCALDGETQCMASVDGVELEALRAIARSFRAWTFCSHGLSCDELEPALAALGELEQMGRAWLTEGVPA